MKEPRPVKPARRRRRPSILRFSLRTMFLVLTITAVLTVWLNHHYQHHQNEQEYLQTLTSVLSQTPIVHPTARVTA